MNKKIISKGLLERMFVVYLFSILIVPYIFLCITIEFFNFNTSYFGYMLIGYTIPFFIIVVYWLSKWLITGE